MARLSKRTKSLFGPQSAIAREARAGHGGNAAGGSDYTVKDLKRLRQFLKTPKVTRAEHRVSAKILKGADRDFGPSQRVTLNKAIVKQRKRTQRIVRHGMNPGQSPKKSK